MQLLPETPQRAVVGVHPSGALTKQPGAEGRDRAPSEFTDSPEPLHPGVQTERHQSTTALAVQLRRLRLPRVRRLHFGWRPRASPPRAAPSSSLRVPDSPARHPRAAALQSFYALTRSPQRRRRKEKSLSLTGSSASTRPESREDTLKKLGMQRRLCRVECAKKEQKSRQGCPSPSSPLEKPPSSSQANARLSTAATAFFFFFAELDEAATGTASIASTPRRFLAIADRRAAPRSLEEKWGESSKSFFKRKGFAASRNAASASCKSSDVRAFLFHFFVSSDRHTQCAERRAAYFERWTGQTAERRPP